VATRRVLDVKFHLLHVEKLCPNPIAKTKPNPKGAHTGTGILRNVDCGMQKVVKA